jgi:hypothetical protein
VAGFEGGFGYPPGVAVHMDGRHACQTTILALTADRHAFANLIVGTALTGAAIP